MLLLLPLSLNGMWMVCAEAEAGAPVNASVNSEVAVAQPECSGKVMCPLHKLAAQAASAPADDEGSAIAATTRTETTGAICLLSPDGTSNSIAAIGFVYAPPAPVQDFELSEINGKELVEFASITYCDATLPNATPPPRA